jgi:tetratricopeptide (TPR) repeat protein
VKRQKDRGEVPLPGSEFGVRMRGLFIFLFLTFFAGCAYADDAAVSIFKNGNQFYEQGMYEEAVKEYTRLLEQGFESGNLYFNLGNSYFKKGEPGRAILNYERAKRLIPTDSDLKANYNFVLSKMENTLPQAVTPSIEKTLGLYNKLTLDGLTVLVSVVYAGIILFLAASLFIQVFRRYRIIVICILLLVFVSGAFSLYSRVSVLEREAIVISKSAEAKFEPLDNATTHFTLYESMKTLVLESKGNWLKISRPDGKSGWIRKDSLEII